MEEGSSSGIIEKQGELPHIESGAQIQSLGEHQVIGDFRRLSSNLFTIVRTPEGGFGVAKIGYSSPADLRRFVHEAAMHKRIKGVWPHGNVNAVPEVYDSFTAHFPDETGSLQEHPVIVTEYVPSEHNLFTYIRDNGRLDMRSTIQRLYPFALGLEALKDAGIVHRDIKPENVFMHNGFGRLADFDLAVDEGYKETGEYIMGTPRYFSPEHWRKEKLTNRSNVWGMGAVTYYALTGEQLMDRNAARDNNLFYSKKEYDAYMQQRMEKIPPTYRSIFRKVVAFAPEDRYDSATQFMIALDKAERHRQLGPKHRGGIGHDLPPARMRPPQHRQPENRRPEGVTRPRR